MTAVEIGAYVAEVESRFRARTPSTDILSALPEQRVGRSEMRAWFLERFGRELDLWDVMELEAPVSRLFRRLRRAFPDERWA